MVKIKQSHQALIIGIVLVLGLVFIFIIPIDIDDGNLNRISNTIGIETTEIIRESKQHNVLQSIFSQEPDFEVDDVQIFIDEISINNTTDVTVSRNLELERIIIFDDGSTDKKTINSASFETPIFDFTALVDDSRPLSNGKINLILSVDVEKEIEKTEGEFTVFFGSDKKIIKTIQSTHLQSDVINKKLTLFNEVIDIKSLMLSKSEGIYPLELRLEKLFIIFKDNSREFVNPLQVLYTINFEKNLAKSIIKDEVNGFVKVYDFDVPITISANAQSVTSLFCLSSYRGGGCASTYSQTAIIPAPSLGIVTITDSNGLTVATKPSMGAGYCTQTQSYALVQGLSNCLAVAGGGGSLTFNAQRGQSYKISVSDPSKSWTVNIPESGGSFSYSCIDAKQSKLTGYTLTGIPVYSIISLGRTCNF